MTLPETIHDIILTLHQPTTDQEEAVGWTDQIKLDTAKAFADALIELERGETSDYFGIVRALDFRGVFGGVLLDSVAAVANRINDTRKP